MNLAPVPLKASQILKNIDRHAKKNRRPQFPEMAIHYGWEPKTEQQIAEIVERLRAKV